MKNLPRLPKFVERARGRWHVSWRGPCWCGLTHTRKQQLNQELPTTKHPQKRQHYKGPTTPDERKLV